MRNRKFPIWNIDLCRARHRDSPIDYVDYQNLSSQRNAQIYPLVLTQLCCIYSISEIHTANNIRFLYKKSRRKLRNLNGRAWKPNLRWRVRTITTTEFVDNWFYFHKFMFCNQCGRNFVTTRTLLSAISWTFDKLPKEIFFCSFVCGFSIFFANIVDISSFPL